MAKKQSPSYYMFVDESGDASLNHKGQHFILSSVIISQDDFEIIQGYLRILKRKYFQDDFKVIHTTDLFERPYQKYRKLIKPRDDMGKFISRLQHTFSTIPFEPCSYHVDKDKLRAKHGYKPVKWKKPTSINIDLPYELTATRAILDFEKYLTSKKCMGEIVIESRLNKDSYFVRYFDNARKPTLPGGVANPRYKNVKDSIPSLFISNKDAGNVGLEIADIVAYATYRKIGGDPNNMMKLPMSFIDTLYSAIKISAKDGARKKLVHTVKA